MKYRLCKEQVETRNMLDRIRIVLVEPRHPGNIGSTARAMKTMGIEQLVLVAQRVFQTPKRIGGGGCRGCVGWRHRGWQRC